MQKPFSRKTSLVASIFAVAAFALSVGCGSLLEAGTSDGSDDSALTSNGKHKGSENRPDQAGGNGGQGNAGGNGGQGEDEGEDEDEDDDDANDGKDDEHQNDTDSKSDDKKGREDDSESGGGNKPSHARP